MKNFSKRPLYEKIALMLQILCAVAVVVFAALELFCVAEVPAYVLTIASGAMLACEGVSFWRTDRKLSVICLCVAGFLAICTVVVIIISALGV